MPTTSTRDPAAASPAAATMSNSDRRTLDILFRHPIAHNLAWMDVVALFRAQGAVEEKANGDLVLEAGGARLVVHKPHSKELTTQEILDVRRHASRAGLKPGAERPEPQPEAAAGDTLVVVDFKEARIYRIVPASADAADKGHGKQIGNAFDPHHILHHAAAQDWGHEHGARTREDAPFYEQIAQALPAAGSIVVMGHGAGKANAAHAFATHLRTHHRDIFQRVALEIVADITALTAPELLQLARNALQ
jgi:hypothetical protein